MVLIGNRKILVRAYFAYVQATFLRALATLSVTSSQYMYSSEWLTTSIRYHWKLLSSPLTITAIPNAVHDAVTYILNKYTETEYIWYPELIFEELMRYSTDLYGLIL